MTAWFIALEGWEASGKSTQAALLAEHLDAVLTREPGGTDLGNDIRQLLLGDGPVPVSRAEALLFAADRAQHLDQVVQPTLRSGRNVVTDRSYGSTLAYQGYGRRQSLEELQMLVEFSTGGRLPDLVILIDVPVDEADVRLGPERDRLESEDDQFRQRVVEGFAELARADPKRWRRVDGSGTIEEVQARVRDVVDAWMATQS
jgi:dTMP kinase